MTLWPISYCFYLLIEPANEPNGVSDCKTQQISTTNKHLWFGLNKINDSKIKRIMNDKMFFSKLNLAFLLCTLSPFCARPSERCFLYGQLLGANVFRFFCLFCNLNCFHFYLICLVQIYQGDDFEVRGIPCEQWISCRNSTETQFTVKLYFSGMKGRMISFFLQKSKRLTEL